MPRTPVSPSGPKEKITISIDPDLVKWVRSRVGVSKDFTSVSAAVEEALGTLRAKRSKPVARKR